MTHKDLSDEWREEVEALAQWQAYALAEHGQSLALAREAWINAFDREAEALDQSAAAENTLLEIDGPLDGGEDD